MHLKILLITTAFSLSNPSIAASFSAPDTTPPPPQEKPIPVTTPNNSEPQAYNSSNDILAPLPSPNQQNNTIQDAPQNLDAQRDIQQAAPSMMQKATSLKTRKITAAHLLEVNNDDDLRSILDVLRRRIDNVEAPDFKLKALGNIAQRLDELVNKTVDFIKVVDNFISQESKILEDSKKNTEKPQEPHPSLLFFPRIVLNATDEEAFINNVATIMQQLRNRDDHETAVKIVRDFKKRLENLQKRATRELDSTKSEIEKLSKRIETDKKDLDTKIKNFEEKAARAAKAAAEEAERTANLQKDVKSGSFPQPEIPANENEF